MECYYNVIGVTYRAWWGNEHEGETESGFAGLEKRGVECGLSVVRESKRGATDRSKKKKKKAT